MTTGPWDGLEAYDPDHHIMVWTWRDWSFLNGDMSRLPGHGMSFDARHVSKKEDPTFLERLERESERNGVQVDEHGNRFILRTGMINGLITGWFEPHEGDD